MSKINQVAFVDPGVPDVASADPWLDIAAIVLNTFEPAPVQMAAALQGRSRLEAIHVLAHGRPGEVSFGAGRLSIENWTSTPPIRRSSAGQWAMADCNCGRAILPKARLVPNLSKRWRVRSARV